MALGALNDYARGSISENGMVYADEEAKMEKKTKETNVGKYLNNKGAWMFGLTDGGKRKKRSPNHLLLSPNVSPGIHTGHYGHSDTDSHPCACVCPLLCSSL